MRRAPSVTLATTVNPANLEDSYEESRLSHLSVSPSSEILLLQSSIMAAKSLENISPIKANEKILPDENQKVKIGRSVSLSKINIEATENYLPAQPQTSKRKTPDHPSPSTKDSPKGKLSVKETKAKFELQEKYRNQRNQKDS